MVSSSDVADCLVIGDGLIGLSTALELSRRTKVLVVGRPREGAASTAAAGLLIPAYERLPEAVRPFFRDSLDRFPAFVDDLAPFDPELRLISGILDRSGLVERVRESDGAVNNVRLLAALRAAVTAAPNATLVEDLVARVDFHPAGVSATTDRGRRLEARRVVLAAGAWSPAVSGLPRALPVRPLKGQMLAFRISLLSQAVMSDDVYLVPREGETLVGATVENAGFDATITDEAIATLRAGAVALYPELADVDMTRAWSGIRPATEDMLPIIGADPEQPALIYACGHSKNGVLLTPATAAAVAALCLDEPSPTPIEAFSIARFSR